MTTLMTEAARERAFRDAVCTSLRGWPPEAAGRSRDCEPVDPDSPELCHRQVARQLRARIQAGQLTGRLPSAVSLARQCETSRDSVLRAIASLKREGLVVTARGSGTFVVPPGDQRS